MRLRTTGSFGAPAAVSTTVPPPILNDQMPLASSGASICPMSVKRLPPDRIWNGTDRTRLAASQLSLNSARSMAMRPLSSLASLIEPASATMRPDKACGTPSGPISPLTRADSGISVFRLPSPRRAARKRSLAKTRRASSSTLRKPFRVGVIEAVSTHGRAGLSEPTVSTMPPPCGRSTLRLISWKVQCLPVRSSSTVRLPFLSPSSRKSWPSSPVSPMPSIQDNSAARISWA